MLNRVWIFAAWTAGPLSAQFGLVAPGNGTDVYFSSTLPLKDSGQPRQGRIFKIGLAPITLVAAFTNRGLPEPCIALSCISNYYDLSGPDLSRDAAVLAYTGRADCTPSSYCYFHSYPYRTTVEGVPGKDTLTFGGVGRLSGNGRYLASYTLVTLYGYALFNLVNLQSGEASTLGAPEGAWFAPGGRIVSDGGTLVFHLNGQVRLAQGSQWVTIPRPSSIQAAGNAVIDAAGQTVVYQACCSPYSELRLFRPDTNQDSLFLKGNGYVYLPVITADGRRVAFLSTAKLGTADSPGPAQVYIANLDGSGLRALTSDPRGVGEFALSDDGRTAWYRSGNNALYQVNTATGEGQQRLPPTGRAEIASHVSPGSAVSITGGGFGNDPRVGFDGIPAPILAQSNTNVLVQVPWEVRAPKPVTVTMDNIDKGVPSPFESLGAIVNADPVYPVFASQPIHQDWSGYVTSASPAHAGEIIYYYATGLGPVQPSVATGTPGPTSPLARVTTTLGCNVPVVFAGLAPGLVGYYLLYLQMPATATAPLRVACGGAAVSYIPMQP